MRVMTTRASIAALLAALALAGCGGDDDGGERSIGPFGATTEAEERPPAKPAPDETETRAGRRPPRPEAGRERTPRSLAACIREAPRVGEVIVKGRKSEDATYFADLVGGRVDVLGVTFRGEGAEHSVFLFESEADARKAAPGAGGEGFEVQLRGAALVVAPPRADSAAIGDCLSATGYARG